MTRPPRPLVITPREGPHITLDDLLDLVAEASSKGIAGSTPVRCAGAVEFNITHGPRAVRLTLDPAEASS